MHGTSRKTLHKVTAVALLGLVLLLFTKHIVFPATLAEIFRLRQNEDGSLPMTTRLWADYPADVYYNFYLWNITNVDEIIYVGAMPRMLEVGPYTYVGKEIKENLTWSDDGNEVTYRNRRYWHFNRSLSCATCEESDRFVVPNAAYLSTATMALYNDMHPLISAVLDVSTMVTGSAPLQTVPAGNLLFHSFEDPLISLQYSTLTKNLLKPMQGTLFGYKLPRYPHPGLLPLYNHTYEPEYRVKTGQGTQEDLTKIVSYGGKKSMEWFMGDAAALQDCNDGGFNKHFLQREDKLHIFQSYLGRKLNLEFYEESSRDSIPTFVYRQEPHDYDTNFEKNVGMRYDNVEGVDYTPSWPACLEKHVYNPNRSECVEVDCARGSNFCSDCCNGSHYGPTVFLPPGFYPLKVFPGRLGRVPFAVFISLPHMLGAPQEVSSLYAGQRPHEEKHRSVEWEVNPTVGTLVHANVRAQMNIALARSPMTQSSRLTSSIAPIFWLHIEVKMRGEIVELVKLGGLYAPLLLNWALSMHLLVAIAGMTALTVQTIFRKSPEKQARFADIQLPRIYTIAAD